MTTQDEEPQATMQKQPERWTRERLEAAIAAHDGPEGLDLAGADLSGLNLSSMDLHGIVLSRWDRQSGTMIVANLQRARLNDANLQGAHLKNVNLAMAVLRRIDLRDADLGGARLFNANLAGAKLQKAWLASADMRHAVLWHADLQEADLGSAKLRNADLGGANLQATDLLGASLQETRLRFTNLHGAKLTLANLQRADLYSANLREVNLLDVREGGLLGIRLYRARLDRTRLKREQLGKAISEELEGEYQEARDAYLALKQNFEDLGDYEAAGWAYRKERRMEKLWARQKAREARSERNWREAVANYRKFVGDQLVEWVCDYGEGIWRVVRALAAVWIIFAVVYGIIAGVWGPWQETAEGQTRQITRNACDLLSFSLGNMVTLQPPGLEARSIWFMRILVPFQALLGIFLAGLLGFVAGNRIRRS